MTEIKRKIHVIGINSFEFKELPLNLQKLFIKTENIAVPDAYFANIKLWAERNPEQKKLLFSSRSDENLINWLKSQKTDVILISRGDPLWFGIGRILLENFSKEELFFASRSDNKLINWLKSQKTDVILFSRGDPLWFGIGRILPVSYTHLTLPTNREV